MDTLFKTGFEKVAAGGESMAYHGIELLGLGALAYPSIKKLTTGKDMNEHRYHQLEAAGLGVLAAPSALAVIKGSKMLKDKNFLRGAIGAMKKIAAEENGLTRSQLVGMGVALGVSPYLLSKIPKSKVSAIKGALNGATKKKQDLAEVSKKLDELHAKSLLV